MALAGSFPREHPERRCLDDKGEAQLIHLACSKAPDGRQRWTLELLADQMVRLEYVEHISPETVRKTLKKLKQYVLIHHCHGCGFERFNRIAADGDFDLVLSLPAQPPRTSREAKAMQVETWLAEHPEQWELYMEEAG